MKERLKLPIGVESFEEIRTDGFYYVDKTKLIEELLNQWGKVNLFTRPRRFGKSLNMSMLRSFFEIGAKPEWFKGLYISENTALCEAYMGKFPVVSISLKGVNGATYEEAKGYLIKVINREARRLQFLMDSPKLTRFDRELFDELLRKNMDDETLTSSLQELSELLEKHFGEKVIVLIDEYDVPLAKANENGFYDEMALLIRNLFENVLKTNDSLKFAVLTGCLRVAKESIFTGLNNFKVYPITSAAFDEYFGFTDQEVKDMLDYYGFSDRYDEVKEWYDGYLFGNLEIYNPWSTLSYVKNKKADSSFEPISFWANTSGNELVVNYIQTGDRGLRKEFELLMNGQTIDKVIKPELTYREMDNINNIYSFLLLTGYLRVIEDLGENKYKLVIPNKEVYEIYKQSFMSYFEDYTFVRKEDLYQCLVKEDVDQANEILGDILSRSISYFDNQESFYHGFLVGLFSGKKIKSNREAMHGRFDLCILPKQIFQTALILECKHSKSVKELVSDAKEGAKQIIDNKYEDEIINDGYLHVKGYGISFYKKYCYIVKV